MSNKILLSMITSHIKLIRIIIFIEVSFKKVDFK